MKTWETILISVLRLSWCWLFWLQSSKFTPYSFVNEYQHFGGTYYLHLQSLNVRGKQCVGLCRQERQSLRPRGQEGVEKKKAQSRPIGLLGRNPCQIHNIVFHHKKKKRIVRKKMALFWEYMMQMAVFLSWSTHKTTYKVSQLRRLQSEHKFQFHNMGSKTSHPYWDIYEDENFTKENYMKTISSKQN